MFTINFHLPGNNLALSTNTIPDGYTSLAGPLTGFTNTQADGDGHYRANMPTKNEPISDGSEKLPTPPELTGISLDTSPQSSKSPVLGEKESTRPNISLSSPENDKSHFLSFVHDHVWANIQFAEQKAAFVFAANTAFLGYIVSTIPAHFGDLNLTKQILLIVTIVFLLISIGTVISIITPRLAGHTKGLVYFGAICNRAKAADYVEEVFRASQLELDSAVALHTYEIAVICHRKQRLIRLSLAVGTLGFLAGLLWITAQHVSPYSSPQVSPDFWNH